MNIEAMNVYRHDKEHHSNGQHWLDVESLMYYGGGAATDIHKASPYGKMSRLST